MCRRHPLRQTLGHAGFCHFEVIRREAGEPIGKDHQVVAVRVFDRAVTQAHHAPAVKSRLAQRLRRWPISIFSSRRSAFHLRSRPGWPRGNCSTKARR